MLVRYTALPYRLWTGSILSLTLMGCSGGDSGMSAAATNPPSMLTADFDSIQANIFTPICSGCHGGANPAANLSLDAAHSYNDLVNVPSTEQPMLERVKPGDPTDSFLVIHLQKDGDGAPASDIPFVIQWIIDGALPGNSAMPMAAQFKVNAVEPNLGDIRQSSPPRIIVGFTQELDATAVNAASMRLELTDDDDADTPIPKSIAIPMSVTIPSQNARALILTPAADLPAGQYQVVFALDPGVAVRSLNGATLSSSAPGDRRESVVTRFTVAPGP
jgi:hypothetical protein